MRTPCCSAHATASRIALLGAGGDEHRLPPVEDRHERLERPVDRAVRAVLRVGARPLEQPVQLVERIGLPAPRRRRPPPPPPPRPPPPPPGNVIASPADARSVFSSHVQPSRFITGISPPIVPPPGRRPTVVMPSTRATGIASLSDWIRDARAQHLVERQHLAHVVVVADAGLVQAEIRARVDHAGIHVRAGGVDDLRAGRDRDVGADRLDPVALDDDRALLDHARRSPGRCARW